MDDVRCLFVGVVTLMVSSVGAQLSQLEQTRSCYAAASESSSTPGLFGGYRSISDPSSNPAVESIVQLAMARLNRVTHDKYRLDTSVNHPLEAFRQVSSFLAHPASYRSC